MKGQFETAIKTKGRKHNVEKPSENASHHPEWRES
jgi:pterin-4a-carbinolamine dehydratase